MIKFEVWNSAKAFFNGIWKRWLWLAFSAVPALLQLLNYIGKEPEAGFMTATIPLPAGVAILLGAILVAAFLAFHDLRVRTEKPAVHPRVAAGRDALLAHARWAEELANSEGCAFSPTWTDWHNGGRRIVQEVLGSEFKQRFTKGIQAGKPYPENSPEAARRYLRSGAGWLRKRADELTQEDLQHEFLYPTAEETAG